jgi:hypothetical protein
VPLASAYVPATSPRSLTAKGVVVVAPGTSIGVNVWAETVA